MIQQALNSYRSHDLSIMIRTSSGDVINLDFSNKKALNYMKNQDKKSISFASMESFSFSLKTSNGIDEQDKKEIQAFMKIAKPYIDKFMDELKQGDRTSPISKVAQSITDTLSSFKDSNTDTKNYLKNQLVNTFDRSLKERKDSIDKIFEDAKKLLEKTLKMFDELDKQTYM